MSDPRPKPKPEPLTLPKLPFVLLGLLSLATFAGPLVIFATVLGGKSPHWPPDRAVEWWVFTLICLSVVVLTASCVTVGIWTRPKKSKGSDRPLS